MYRVAEGLSQGTQGTMWGTPRAPSQGTLKPYVQFGNADYINLHVIGLWEETHHASGENMQTPCKGNRTLDPRGVRPQCE